MPSFRARATRFLLRHIFGRRFLNAGKSVEALRRLDQALARSQRPLPGTRIVEVSEKEFTGEWIRGPGAVSHAVLLYLHGGGFVMGSPGTHRELASRLSGAAGIPVLSVDYRLAPEHPFPAALEDVLAAYRWLLAQGRPHTEIVIGGESSGGGLAVQTLLALKDDGTPLPSGGLLLSPVVDWLDFDAEQLSTRAHLDPLVSLEQCRFTASLYVADAGGTEPLLRPLKNDLRGLPPLWIQAGDHEILLGDSERLARRAEEDGVTVELKVWPGMWHVFQAAARVVPEARVSVQEAGGFVRGCLDR